LAGIREQIAIEIGKLEEDISIIKSDLMRQEDTIEQRLKVVSNVFPSTSQYYGQKKDTFDVLFLHISIFNKVKMPPQFLETSFNKKWMQ